MPTLFARRYMRKLEEVPATEKVVGACVVVLIVIVVATFVFQAETNTDYLFDVDESVYRTGHVARELAVAKQMLPSLGDPAWRAASEPEALSSENMNAALGDAAADFEGAGVRWLYRRRYETIDEPKNGMSVEIGDTPSPASASALCQARRPAESHEFGVGRGGWLAEDKLSAGFWNGRYYTELHADAALSGSMTMLKAARAIAAVQLSYGEADEREVKPAEAGRSAIAEVPRKPDSILPEPEIPGWRTSPTVQRFSPEELYQKINGRADAYIQYNVAELKFGTYYKVAEPERSFDVYWYDMREPRNAFGMYRSEAPLERDNVAIGREGYRAEAAVYFWKGASYVQVLPASFDEADAGVALGIAKQLAGLIKDSGKEFAVLKLLPLAKRVANSEGYIARDVFGLEFLSDVFTVAYEMDGGRLTLFIHDAGDDAAARALFDEYGGFLEKYGRVFWRAPETSDLLVAGDVGGLVDVVFAKGGYLGGVAGAEDAEAAKAAAVAFHDELKPR